MNCSMFCHEQEFERPLIIVSIGNTPLHLAVMLGHKGK